MNGNEITNGVHEITIARTVSGADRGDVASDALIMAENQLGSNLSNNVDYGKEFSHVFANNDCSLLILAKKTLPNEICFSTAV